jgi:1,5-anhydro-D-fructose reductase (1,5-anhydro-D-mannitol-forming)
MINYGIVGFGLHGVRRLMPGFELAENSRATAVCRRDRGRAEKTARDYNIAHAFTSLEELCRCPDVDAVFVTSPNNCHLSDVLTAIRCGKPVLCEKPLAMNADEARQMVTAAREAKVLFGVAHVFRFCETTARLRHRIATEEIGRPTHARAEFSFFAPPDHPRAWLHDRSIAGGGPIADIGVHCIDTLRFVLQDEVVRVSAIGVKDKRSGDVEAAAVLALEFARGTLAQVAVSYRAEYHTAIEIHGEGGSLVCDKGMAVDFPVTINLIRGNQIVDHQTVSNQLAYAKQVDEFSAAVEGKRKYRIPGEDGWQNQVILDAAYQSMETGKTVEVTRVIAAHV